jgi:hypothetical protein
VFDKDDIRYTVFVGHSIRFFLAVFATASTVDSLQQLCSLLQTHLPLHYTPPEILIILLGMNKDDTVEERCCCSINQQNAFRQLRIPFVAQFLLMDGIRPQAHTRD